MPNTLTDIKSWTQEWCDAGSGQPTDYSLWRGVPAGPEYVVLGSFFVRSHSPPTAADTRGMKAVHRDVLVSISASDEIWTDAGSGARQDGAIWSGSALAKTGVHETGAFVAVKGYNNPPPSVYVINACTVVMIK